jgi:hypothetical protein
MPYSVGEKGSYGCSGYPVIKDDDKQVMGCHDTAAEAGAQIAAIEANENKTYEEKEVVTSAGGVGIKNPQAWPGTEIEYRKPKLVNKNDITEGDYVMGMTSEGIAHGRVEHIMWEGGTLGEPGTEYAIESMPPENPAMSVRVYEDNDGTWEATAYSIGMMYQDAQKLPSLEDHNMPEDMEDEMLEMSKAETYSPNAGMKAAARRAIKWREGGKATGAGTPVGWGRARDIVAGRSMSLSVVKRMYSFFSRHEVDKKGKDFYNTSNPSNGRIMWDAWGGDAGFSWSRAIVKRNEEKALFADFGKDYTKAQRLTEFGKAYKDKKGYGKDDMYKAVRTGSMVSWNSSGGRAEGKVTRIITSGTYNVPGTSVSLNASSDDPVAVIRLYRNGEPTDTIVAHKLGTLRVKS